MLQLRISHDKNYQSFYVLYSYWSSVCDATRLLLVSRQSFVLLQYKSDTTWMVWLLNQELVQELTQELTHEVMIIHGLTLELIPIA